MNGVQIFNYQTHEVRTVQKDGEPWFVLKDVCQVLGIARGARSADRLEPDEVRQTYITDSLGRQQETTIINESGLYNVILRSDKPEAKPFRKWVTSEVIPSIRKHGIYATEDAVEEILSDLDTAIRLLGEIKAERQKRKELEGKVKADAPKVLFADAVSASHTSILVGDLAKLIRQNGVDIGQNRLFRWLRDNDYLCKSGERYNLPTQRSMDLGLFSIKETVINNPDGSVRVTRTVKVTGRGQQYFIEKFLAG